MADAHTSEGGDEEILAEVIRDQESLKIHRKKVARQLNLFFHTIDKFILLLRVYPSGHPLVEEFAERMMEQLQDVFALESQLYVRVKATELLLEWGDVFFTSQESERENFLWYVPSIDGLVSVVIDDGITLNELIRFFDIINKSSMGQFQLDDDTVTMLWEADLEHVFMHAVEGHLDMSDNAVFGAMSEPEAKITVINAAIAPSGEENGKLHALFEGVDQTVDVDVFTSMQYKSTELVPSFEMPPHMLADAFRVDHSWRDELVEEWVSGDDLEYRLIESLLSIVRTSFGTEEAQEAIDTIQQLTEHLIDVAEYATASSVLTLIRHRQKLFDSDETNPLTLLIIEITQPMRIEALLFQAQKDLTNREALFALLQLFDHDQVQRQILGVLSTPSKQIRALDALLDLLFQSTNKENARQLLAPEYTDKALFFERLLPGFDRRSISDFEIAPRLLTMAMKHDTVAIRKQVLHLADESWCSSLVIEQFIKPRMSDEDPEVRKLAMDAMRKLDPASFDVWLSKAIDFDTLGFRAAGEIKFLLLLYIEQDGSNLETLRQMLATRGWFNQKRRNLARAVARVLLELDDAQTFALIEKQATSLLTAPALREEYTMLLSRHAQSRDDEFTTQEEEQ